MNGWEFADHVFVGLVFLAFAWLFIRTMANLK